MESSAHVLISLVREGTLQTTEREMWTPTFDLQSVLSAQYANAINGGTELWEQPTNV